MSVYTTIHYNCNRIHYEWFSVCYEWFRIRYSFFRIHYGLFRIPYGRRARPRSSGLFQCECEVRRWYKSRSDMFMLLFEWGSAASECVNTTGGPLSYGTSRHLPAGRDTAGETSVWVFTPLCIQISIPNVTSFHFYTYSHIGGYYISFAGSSRCTN